MHCFTLCMAVIFIFFITNKGYCQVDMTGHITGQGYTKDPLVKDSTAIKDTLAIRDSLSSDTLFVTDSLGKRKMAGVTDTNASKKQAMEESLGIKISKDALPSVVKSESRDSAIMDMKKNLFYSYGKAQVNYEDLQLNAGQIVFEQGSNIVSAAPYEAEKDTTEKETFAQGKEKFTFDSLQYNFKSKRAIVRNVHSQYGEGFVYSEQVKRNPDQSIFGAHSIYTTCALDTPHFGIYADRIKVIPGRVIVSGPANLRIEGIPTPLFLPFGLFPVSQKQKSGFILPTYTIEEQRGLGLLNGGYYFYINDHVDFLAQSNIYSKGSYGLSGISNYNYIYHYSGAINFSYAKNKYGEVYEPGAQVKKDFLLNWRHQSDGKSVPGQSFNASVQLGTSSFYSNNSYDANQILQNQYSSNISYSKSWQGTPLGLTISALHNQNTATKLVNVTLPSINFHVTQLNPFQSKNDVGSHWYDKITTSYSMDALNRTSFYDTAFHINKLGLTDFQSGVHHSIPVSASYTLLRYINTSFSVNYNEYWLTDRLIQQYSYAHKKMDSFDSRGFFAARSFDAGVNFSTRIYGMKMFKKGGLKGIRHVLTPNVGYTYHPDFGDAPFNYYYHQRLDSNNNFQYQSPYVTSIVGTPPLGKVGSVNFGLGNNLQIKVRSAKDTVSGFKNVTLIDAFNISSGYNIAADSFNWSNISMSFATNVLNKISISANASFDPYKFDYNRGIREKETMYEKGEGIGRFTNANIAVGSNFHSKPAGGARNPTNSEEYARVMRNAGYNDYVDFNIPWSFNFSYSMTASKNYTGQITKRDTLVVTHSLTFDGDLQLTKRWKLTVGSGYNFNEKALSLTNLNLYRDLHCWTMHLQTYPFGPRKSFSFTLNVKSAVLQDLKLVKRRDFRDTPN
ncbi:MAG: organic solvent tolerance protein OstA [Flavipsychrobacter sp.]|nr:organic solvent tolerance protein OstA [Flavipsychrobacter sp.]